jgi:hypothetical protein
LWRNLVWISHPEGEAAKSTGQRHSKAQDSNKKSGMKLLRTSATPVGKKLWVVDQLTWLLSEFESEMLYNSNEKENLEVPFDVQSLRSTGRSFIWHSKSPNLVHIRSETRFYKTDLPLLALVFIAF